MMEDIPPKFRSLLTKSPLWDGSGMIRLTPRWAPLKEVAKRVEDETGIYFLGYPVSIGYPEGKREGSELFFSPSVSTNSSDPFFQTSIRISRK